MRNAIATLVFLAASAAAAQSVNIQIDPNTMSMGMEVKDNGQAPPVEMKASSKQVEERSENTFKYRYESNESGKTLVKVLAPEGAHVDVYDGTERVASDDIPTSFPATGEIFYRFVVRAPNGATFEKKFAARKGHTFSLWVKGPNVEPAAVVVSAGYREPAPPPPAPPPAPVELGMASGDFESLKAAIKQEDFSEEQLGVLRTAADGARFSAAQVGELVDLYTFSKDKLDALRIVKGKIVDRNNNYKILGHFEFASDKQEAQAMLR